MISFKKLFSIFFGAFILSLNANDSIYYNNANLDENQTLESKKNTSKSSNQNIANNNEIKNSENLIDYEFKDFKNDDVSLMQSIINRFSLNEETYVLPIYYSFRKPYYPVDSIAGEYSKAEVKLQVSFKTLIFENIFANIGLYFAYTQTSFFQIYAPILSSPFRDNDFIPELIAYRPLDVHFWGGKLYNVRLGYNHISNGEGIDEVGFKKSRGIDRIFADIMYRIGNEDIWNLDIALKAWTFLRKDPINVDSYLGYSSLRLTYDLYKDHHFILNIGNLFHNYAKYKGSIRLEYKYDLFDSGISLYAQYFYGYGDNLFEYNILSHKIGIGIAVTRW
ncbi:MAG: phospholipase A [Helicobacteraceae bacterium]|nr:phospholipase A [Helicobacteraceae bacterium]